MPLRCYNRTVEVLQNVSLKDFTTMGLGGSARFMADVHSTQEVREAYLNAKSQSLPVFVLGGGSNTVAHDDGFKGTVLRVIIPGFEIISDDSTNTTIKIGAGENWDSVVARTVDMNLSGIEALSSIPGTTGAAPVQNIGAYGQEVADTLVSVDAYDTKTDKFAILSAADCQLSYRNSIFRAKSANRYIITYVTLKLFKSPPSPPFYRAVQDYLDSHNIADRTVQTIRDAVIQIRVDKLPDPKARPNTGSFFKNTIIEQWQLNDLRKQYSDMPAYEMADNMYKIPTGWLIEQLGFKGKLIHGIRVHDKNSLVLINESAQSYNDLAQARDEIIQSVRDRYRIDIVQEPLELSD